MQTNRGQRKRKSAIRVWPALLVAALCGGLVYFLAAEAAPTDASDGYMAAENNTAENFDGGFVALPIEFVSVAVGEFIDTGYLALINREFAVPPSLYGGALVPVWPTAPVSFIDGMYLHPSALAAVADMLASARAAGVGSFFVGSGFRGQAHQAELYANDRGAGFVLPPGHSEHHMGLAADIFAVGVCTTRMGDSVAGRWLADNAHRYGLILRYPQGAEEITGINFEPWHFRYVGRAHAEFMRRNEFVLEEYIAFIHETEGFYFDKEGVRYYVFHHQPRGGRVYLPVGMRYTVSGDNVSGYIITAWE